MELKKVKCESFAGLVDAELDFKPGLNVIVGQNESGKTTITDLIRSTLFQDAKVGAQTAEDKAFRALSYPHKVSGIAGDPDGELHFIANDGEYRLRKEWGRDGSVSLRTPEGTRVKEPSQVQGIVDPLLEYGVGSYDEVVFASQHRVPKALQTMMDAAGKPGEEQNDLASAIKGAVMETGGIDLDAFDRMLQEKMEGLDRNWDFDIDLPKSGLKRGIKKKWSSCGAILNAYYACEEAKVALDDVQRQEGDLERLQRELKKAKELLEAARGKKDRFDEARGAIERRKVLQGELANAQKALKLAQDAKGQAEEKEKTFSAGIETLEKVQDAWPKFSAAVERIDSLSSQVKAARDYEALKQKQQKVQQAQAHLEGAQAAVPQNVPSKEDAEQAKSLEKAVASAESKMRGMNLAATLRNLGDVEIRVTSAVDGRAIDLAGGAFDITEAVVITVPGVLELNLAPKGIDAAAVSAQLETDRAALAALMAACGASCAEDMAESRRAFQQAQKDVLAAQKEVERELAGQTLESLQQAFADTAVPEKTASELAADLAEFCKGKDSATFRGALVAQVEGFQGKYQNAEAMPGIIAQAKADLAKQQDEVKQKELAVADAQNRLAECEEKCANAPELPAEFAAIDDFDGYLAEIDRDIENYTSDKDRKQEDVMSRAALLTESASSEDLQREVEEKQHAFETLKEEYARWQRIKETAHSIATAGGDPMANVQQRFAECLATLSDKKVSLDGLSDNLGAAVSSGTNQVSWQTASEGTRDIIALAFRIALFEHLFPQGGFMVLDDPFTDMDPQRTQLACELLKEFAQENQVIFTTCDPKYIDLLQGANVIQWTS